MYREQVTRHDHDKRKEKSLKELLIKYAKKTSMQPSRGINTEHSKSFQTKIQQH